MNNESSSGRNPFHDQADRKAEDAFNNAQNMSEKDYQDKMKEAAYDKKFAEVVDDFFAKRK